MSFDPTKYTKSRWLKGGDLEAGRQYAVTIKRAFEYTFEQDGETKPVLEFKGWEQQLVLNKTQIKALIDALGQDVDEWGGQRISLMAVPSSFQGKPTILVQAVAKRQPVTTLFAEPEFPPNREHSDSEAPGDEDWDRMERPF